jgi:hypothetical protein
VCKKKRPFWQLAEEPVLASSGRTVLLAGIDMIIREKYVKIIPFHPFIIPILL